MISQLSTPRLSTAFVVRRAPGSYALKFVSNLCGRHVNAAADADANHFDAHWQAELKAKEFGLTEREYFIDTITVTEPAEKHRTTETL